MSIDWSIAQPMPNYFAQINQARAMGEQRRDRNTLRELAPAALQGDQAALDQVTAIDPARGQQLDQAAEGKARKLRGAALYVKRAIDSGDPAAIQAAYNGVSPFLQQVTGKPVPPFDPSHLEGIEQILAQTAYLDEGGKGGRVQSTYIDEQGNRVAIMADGRTTVLGKNAPQNQIFDTGDGVVGINRNTLDYKPITPAGHAPAPQRLAAPPQGSNLDSRYAATAQFMERNGVPADKVAEWVASQPGMVPAGEGSGGAALEPPQEQLRSVPKPAEQERMRLAEEASRRSAEASARDAERLDLARRADARADRKAEVAPAGRPLPNQVVQKLTKAAEIRDNLSSLGATFKDDYAGNTLTGAAENVAGQLGLPGATPGQADWWQQYDRQKNIVRNELFGSALTPGEQAAFERADIRPSMAPDRIRANLAMQRRIIDSGLARQARVWKTQGYNPDAIGAAVAPAAASTYTVGQVIEHGGKRYRVTDVSDPNDPDLEELR